MTAEDFVVQIKKEENTGVSPLSYGRLIYLMEKYKESELKELQHHKDITVGLWATDRLDLIEDPKKLLFEIK
tara:strand:+ start:338 stop:553 length:216 start_codon:yes stop_codon:yes gene_type:complete